MDKFKKNIFIPITKVDDEERMVYGWASTPDMDSDGEIIKSEALEKALPAYLKFPTLREMHQPKAVGTTKQAEVSKKGMYIGAKVVADDTWKLVKENVLRAFSVGGNVLKRVGNVIQELELVEISLVDVPANKSAVVELWKSGKLTKNAEMAYSMANLMIQIKDMISYCEMMGKDTKKLKKALRLIKDLVSDEAMEDEEINDMKLKALESMKFEDDEIGKIADSLRKGVILVMKTNKAEELKKVDTKAPVVEEKVEAEKEEVAEDAPETTEPEVVESPVEDDETKESGELEATLTKIQEIEDKLIKLTPQKVKEEKSDDLSKAVGSIAGTLEKVADALMRMEERLKKVEGQPAALKSRAAIVHKTLANQSGQEPEEPKAESSELVAKKKRLADLYKIFDAIGPSAFSKQGFSTEAMSLQNEIQRLS